MSECGEEDGYTKEEWMEFFIEDSWASVIMRSVGVGRLAWCT